MMTIKSKSEGTVEEPNDAGEPSKEKKRRSSTYEEGFGPLDFKDSSVRRLIILALSPTCETHENLELILDRLSIKHLDFGFSADIKMLLLLEGKMSASARHPCPFCTADKDSWEKEGELLTLGMLWKYYHDFHSTGDGGGAGNEKNAKFFQNVVRPPLITGHSDQLILGQTMFFPELHVLIGCVGKLVKEFERSQLFSCEGEGHEFVDEWLKKQNIERTKFHGSANFTG